MRRLARPVAPRTLMRRAARALTLIELLIVISVVGVLVALVGPSMAEMIGMQRLRGIAAQMATDMQFARSEAVARNRFVGFSARATSGAANRCYSIYTNGASPANLLISGVQTTGVQYCNCHPDPAVCVTLAEARTVRVPTDFGIQLRWPSTQPDWFAINPISGGVESVIGSGTPFDHEFCYELSRSPRGRLRVDISLGGRTSICSPDQSVTGYPVCAAYDAVQKNCPGLPAPT
jgi:type IV fimbrial biogenesis protein FimT